MSLEGFVGGVGFDWEGYCVGVLRGFYFCKCLGVGIGIGIGIVFIGEGSLGEGESDGGSDGCR